MNTYPSQFANVNGIKIHYVTAGDGPLVILLHGFPESSYAWRKVIPGLSKHFKVVVPDMRGYGESDKPEGVEAYRASEGAADVAGLIQSLGREKAHVVGHDWGGSIAWKFASLYPEKLDHLVVINSPYPAIFLKSIRSNYKQLLKSWYMFFFQIPHLPEWLLKKNSKKILKKILQHDTIQRDAFTNEDIEYYDKAIKKPGALTAMINYYRAALKKQKHKENEPIIKAPTLLIWGEQDKVLGKDLTYGMDPYFEELVIHYIPNCSHWVPEEQPEVITKLITAFFNRPA